MNIVSSRAEWITETSSIDDDDNLFRKKNSSLTFLEAQDIHIAAIGLVLFIY